MAIYRLANGVLTNDVCVRLGHAYTGMTLQMCAHAMPEMQAGSCRAQVDARD